jgi:predicted anti-sigma-YlaC factor YlaD
MLNCKQATQMLSEKLDRPLSTKEKLSLGMHTSMCLPCRQFGKQMQELRFMSKRYTRGESESEK